MKIHILGPFRISHHGVDVTLTAPKLRQVMAVFAVTANRLIRTDQLIDELWPEHPPVSAMTTLQTYIYQLRKLMRLGNPSAEPVANGGPVALTTQPSGYLLRLPDDAIDIAEFERLAERGRTELAADRVEAAADMLRGALEVWRGPALADVPTGPLLRSEVVRLEELRRSVLELRIAADLQLARHHDLIGELTNLVVADPTHEGFQGKLMLALHLAGRRSEALRVYQNTRDALSEELGVEPSAELQRLQRSILVADHATGTVLAGRSSNSVEPPAQLPPQPTGLVGRAEQVHELCELVTGDPAADVPPVALVTGPPGSGSTTLCTHVAYKVRDNFPDGHFYAKLTTRTGRVEPGDVLADFLRSTGTLRHGLPDDVAERSSLFRSWTARRKVLVLLDDVVDTEQLTPLLPSGPGCATIASTRSRMHTPLVSGVVAVPPLADADAFALLVGELGILRVRRQTADARRLVDLSDGLPLVLNAATTILRVRAHWPIARLLRSENLPLELGIAASVRATLDLLPAESRSAFSRLATASAVVTPESAAEMLETDQRSCEAMLESLVDHHLAKVESSDVDGFRFRFSRLVRLSVRYLALASTERMFA